MNILSFISIFPDEKSCQLHFKLHRDKKGVICKSCNCLDHYWLKNKFQYQCKSCGFRTTLKSGTLLEHSKLPFRYWYIAIHLITCTKKGISAHEMRRQLGHKRYEPIWNMMHKIRKAMGLRNTEDILQHMVELDDAYITTQTTRLKKSNLKRGKGSNRKSKVTVLAESTPLESDNGDVDKRCGKFFMVFNPDEKSKSIDRIVKSKISTDAIVFSDSSKAYVNIENWVEIHVRHISKDQKENLKWVHIAIANLKRNLLGIFHSISQKFIQLYLDEFVYKLNRRNYKNGFDTLVQDLI